VCEWRGLEFGLAVERRRRTLTMRERLDRAGLVDVARSELAARTVLLAVIGAALAFVLSGALLPAACSLRASRPPRSRPRHSRSPAL
jgi:hypothetical protein